MRFRPNMLSRVPFSLLFAFLAWTGAAIAQAPWPGDPNLDAAQDAQSLPEEDRLLATTEYRHVAGSVFVPLYEDAGVTYGSKGCTYMSSTTHAFMNYSLDLPTGSRVTSVRLYFNDTAATDGTLHLAEYDDGASYSYLATVTTSGSSGLSYNTVTGLDIHLDYLNYSYVLYWVPGVAGSTMQLCGFRVSYVPPTIFTDGFESGGALNWSAVTP